MPRFSIITPVYDPPANVLADTIASVVNQTFGDFEWVLCNDASPGAWVAPQLAAAAAADPRITVVTRETNGGIAAASADALAVATGEFVVLLDHDDTLAATALAEVDAALAADDTIDYLYTDEDLLSAAGEYIDPFHKPGFSPERLRSHNYCCHLSVLRRSVVEDVGGFRPGFDGSQDYDLILRVTEQARTVCHLPRILYHWRQIPGSVADQPDAKPHAYEAGRRAIAEHCERLGIDADVEEFGPLGCYRVRRHLRGNPLVSVIIPTCGSRGRVWGVERWYVVDAVASLLERGTYDNLQFVVVADDHTPPEVLRLLRQLLGDRLVLIDYDRPFNFSAKVNLGRVHADGDLLLLLNDDVELISPDAIETMAPLALEADVGSVGAKLLFADGTLQHAGHLYNGPPDHILFGWSDEIHGVSRGMLGTQRECIGVTAACLMTRPEVFDEMGGFSEDFPGHYNDVDFALKLHTAGYRNVFTPHAVLYHFESVSRDPKVKKSEAKALEQRWGHLLGNDPYYNINLEPERNDWVERGGR